MTRCLFLVLATVCVLGPENAAAQSADPPEAASALESAQHWMQQQPTAMDVAPLAY